MYYSILLFREKLEILYKFLDIEFLRISQRFFVQNNNTLPAFEAERVQNDHFGFLASRAAYSARTFLRYWVGDMPQRFLNMKEK